MHTCGVGGGGAELTDGCSIRVSTLSLILPSSSVSNHLIISMVTCINHAIGS